jgi:hypothetical protein
MALGELGRAFDSGEAAAEDQHAPSAAVAQPGMERRRAPFAVDVERVGVCARPGERVDVDAAAHREQQAIEAHPLAIVENQRALVERDARHASDAEHDAGPGEKRRQRMARRRPRSGALLVEPDALDELRRRRHQRHARTPAQLARHAHRRQQPRVPGADHHDVANRLGCVVHVCLSPWRRRTQAVRDKERIL